MGSVYRNRKKERVSDKTRKESTQELPGSTHGETLKKALGRKEMGLERECSDVSVGDAA